MKTIISFCTAACLAFSLTNCEHDHDHHHHHDHDRMNTSTTTTEETTVHTPYVGGTVQTQTTRSY